MAFNVIRTNNSLQARHSTLNGLVAACPVLEHKARVRLVFHYVPQSIDSSNPSQFINNLFLSAVLLIDVQRLFSSSTLYLSAVLSIDSSNPSQFINNLFLSIVLPINSSTPIQFINTLFVSCAVNRHFKPPVSSSTTYFCQLCS